MYQHLFAIVERLPAFWRTPASSLGAVAARPVDELTLLASPCEGVPEANARTLASHHDVVSSTLDAAAVLPFRFGTVVPATELPDWLEAHRTRIRTTLTELRGQVEMSVKLLRLHCGHGADRACPECAGGAPGAAELGDLAERLVERAGVARWRFSSSAHGDNIAGSVAFLVPRQEVHAFLARIAPVASHAAGIAVVPTGPWPAYSFAGNFDRLPLARVPAAPPSGERRLG
ncbi:MAG TPA: GvpL/GvpF family gas vesicle protein [Methylomirabilota bacterium]|nr:GvpL/GvpF family gas vesicle protein [Methylomirabilota bacterium]